MINIINNGFIVFIWLNGDYMKLLKYVIKSLMFGVLIIFLVNVGGQFININIPVNIINFLIVSFLRFPGVATILIFNLILFKK